MRAARALLIAALGLAAGCAEARRPPETGHMFAQPSDIAATEIAYRRLADAKGFTAATRAFAAPGAEILTPQPVRVAAWGGANRPGLVWSPARIWISCDGSYALSYGGWHEGSANGWFATVWQRQKKGVYRFVLDQGGPLAAPLGDAEMIDAHVADCPARIKRPGDGPGPATVRDEIDAGRLADEDTPEAKKPKRPSGPPDPNAADAAAALTADWLHGESRDHTLGWQTTVGGDGTPRLVVRAKVAGQWAQVLTAP